MAQAVDRYVTLLGMYEGEESPSFEIVSPGFAGDMLPL